jgi:predicted dehydrogenase
MKEYGFAIIGCGAIARMHVLAVNDIENAKLVGVYDNFFESAEKFASEWKCKAYKSIEELLNDGSVDVVNICTPSGLHASLAVQVANAKKNIVVEKPLAITKEQTDQVVSAVKSNGVKCEVVAQLRFTEAVQKLKKIIDDGKLGKIYTVDYTMKYYRSQEYYDKGAWRGTWEMDGGGVLMNQGIHGIDLVQYLVGGIEKVYADCRTLARNIEVEDTANVLVEYTCGAVGTIRATTIAEPGFPREIEIIGEKGSVVLKEDVIERLDIQGEEQISGANTNLCAGSDPMAIPYKYHKLQIMDLISAMEKNGVPLVNEDEGRKPVDIILSIYKSNKEGKKVTV